MVHWLDDATLKFDVVQSKDIVPPKDSDVLSLPPGTQCYALFKGKVSKVDIIASGMLYYMHILHTIMHVCTCMCCLLLFL